MKEGSMFNLRKVDKFYLSGGWDHVPDDTKHLKSLGIKAILDLQFIEGDSPDSIRYIKESCNKQDIEYRAIFMEDGEFNTDILGILENGSEYLTEMEKKYPGKRESILVKCAVGISRSPTMLMNHFCSTRRMSAYEALAYIRAQETKGYSSEFGASPNVYFRTILQDKYKDAQYEA